MTEFRNARHSSADAIDCDYKHPVHGWIPFTARQSDVEPLGRELYAAVVAAGGIAPMPEKSSEQVEIEAKAAKRAQAASDVKADAKLATLSNMTPAQVRAWVAANVTNLADAKDVIATLAVAVSVLTGRI